MPAGRSRRKEEEIDRLDRELRAINACRQVLRRAADVQWLCDNEYFLEHRGIHIKRGMRPEDLFSDPVFVQRWRDYYERPLAEGAYTTEYVVFSGWQRS